jgi:hypothetical protein
LLTGKVPTGQIGVDLVKVETVLTTIFKIANWKAILLLDEAALFLAQRSNDPYLKRSRIGIVPQARTI